MSLGKILEATNKLIDKALAGTPKDKTEALLGVRAINSQLIKKYEARNIIESSNESNGSGHKDEYVQQEGGSESQSAIHGNS